MSPRLSTLLTILLMMAIIPDKARSSLKVSSSTIAYVNARHEAAKSLIELNPQVYIFTVFRHFRAHFADVPIAHSHLPILLEDLGLMPRVYLKPGVYRKATMDRMDLRTLHHVWQLHNVNQPDGDYFNSMVVIPVELRDLFVRNNREQFIQSKPYKQLLDQMETTAQWYPVNNISRRTVLRRATRKKYRVLAIFWLTVMDRYIRTLEANGYRIDMNTFERTTLQFPEGRSERVEESNQVRRPPNGGPNPGQVAGPSVQAIDRPGTSGVGTNPKRRASAPEALGALSRGTKRKAANQGPFQGGGKRSRGGSIDRSVDGVSKAKLQVEQVRHHKRVQFAQYSALY